MRLHARNVLPSFICYPVKNAIHFIQRIYFQHLCPASLHPPGDIANKQKQTIQSQPDSTSSIIEMHKHTDSSSAHMKYKANCVIVIKKLLPLLSNAHLQEEQFRYSSSCQQNFREDLLDIYTNKLHVETYQNKLFSVISVKLINKVSSDKILLNQY